MTIGPDPLVARTFRPFDGAVQICPNGMADALGQAARESGAARVAAIVDPSFAAGPVPEALAAALPCPLSLHSIPPGEPDTDGVEALRAHLAAWAPDLIVAIGGGSTMDATKVARVTLRECRPVAELAGFDTDFGRPVSRLVCVPTTAGTASEVSHMAVISQAGLPVKLRYRAAHMAADLALLDAALTLSLPPGPTAESGADALTHALESLMSPLASPFTDALAVAALRELWRALPVAIARPGELSARQACLAGATMAGLAFNETQLGLSHAISAVLGAQHGLRHGLANALVLPAVLHFNLPSLSPSRREVLTEVMGPDPAEAAACWLVGIGIAPGLAPVCPGLDPAALAPAILQSSNIRTNPRPVALTDAVAVLEAAA